MATTKEQATRRRLAFDVVEETRAGTCKGCTETFRYRHHAENHSLSFGHTVEWTETKRVIIRREGA